MSSSHPCRRRKSSYVPSITNDPSCRVAPSITGTSFCLPWRNTWSGVSSIKIGVFGNGEVCRDGILASKPNFPCAVSSPYKTKSSVIIRPKYFRRLISNRMVLGPPSCSELALIRQWISLACITQFPYYQFDCSWHVSPFSNNCWQDLYTWPMHSQNFRKVRWLCGIGWNLWLKDSWEGAWPWRTQLSDL